MPMLRLLGAVRVMGAPPIRMSPPVTLSKPASSIRTVVFPEPDGPKRVMNSPLATSRSNPFTTSTLRS